MNKFYTSSVAFIIGFASLLYQTYAIHIVFQFFPKGSDIVALSLAAFLCGLGVSAILFSKLAKNETKKAEIVILISQILLILVAFLFYRNMEFFTQAIGIIDSKALPVFATQLSSYGLIWIYLFTPAFLIGGCLPLIISMHQSTFEKRFDETSFIYFLDIIGAVLGSLVTGFYLIPYLGFETTIALAIIMSFLAMLFVLKNRIHIMVSTLVTLCLVAVLFFDIATQEKQETIETSANITESDKSRFGDILFKKESRFGTIRVADVNDTRRLFINYRTMCVVPLERQTIFTGDAEDLLALITLTNLEEESDILGIGLGCGITADIIARHPKTGKFNLVEINPIVVESYNKYFAIPGDNIFDLDHISLSIEDGARYLRVTDKTYDAIILDIEEVDIIHSSPLFTRNYFKIAKSKLKEGGIFSVWSFYVNEDFNKGSRGVVYFASDKEININNIDVPDLPEPIEISEKLDDVKINQVINNDNEEINTILNPVLRKYYNSRDFFKMSNEMDDNFIIPQ